MAPIAWEACMGGAWLPLDDKSAKRLEQTFAKSSRPTVEVSITLMGCQKNWAADVEKMTLGDLPMRRVSSVAPAGTVHFWDDYAWTQFDANHADVVLSALAVKRKTATVYVGDGPHCSAKVIQLVDNGLGYTQVDRQSQRTRPVLIVTPATIPYLPKELDWNNVEAHKIPGEFICPVTQLPFFVPVVTSDGHTYEYSAITRWLKKKCVSPINGDAITSFVTVNHSLRAVMSSWLVEYRSKVASRSKVCAARLKRKANELKGDESLRNPKLLKSQLAAAEEEEEEEEDGEEDEEDEEEEEEEEDEEDEDSE